MAKYCLGETTSPHYPLFKGLHDNWLELVEDTNHSGIDYKLLELYQWGENKILDEQAHEVMEWGWDILKKESFKRGEYKQVVQLTLVWLGGAESMGPDWQFPQPSAYHHAKFISQILYIMKFGLLGDQV